MLNITTLELNNFRSSFTLKPKQQKLDQHFQCTSSLWHWSNKYISANTFEAKESSLFCIKHFCQKHKLVCEPSLIYSPSNDSRVDVKFSKTLSSKVYAFSK
uniref:(northern house mosquito) hypothetical protein n=1 Tax=Culex pipiens TaxID=7175 RepID=A0A8D8JCY7_CULPI